MIEKDLKRTLNQEEGEGERECERKKQKVWRNNSTNKYNAMHHQQSIPTEDSDLLPCGIGTTVFMEWKKTKVCYWQYSTEQCENISRNTNI